MPIPPRSHTVPANGLSHHVLEWGDASAAAGSGTAILIHGFMDAAGTFDLLAPSLADAGLRVLAPDMRGFGLAPRAPAGSYYYFFDYVADVAAILDALVPEKTTPLLVVGHSMGGTVASYFAGAFPERVTKLALLEGVGPLDNPVSTAPVRLRRWINDIASAREKAAPAQPIESMDEALRRLALNHRKVDIELLRTRVPHLVTRESNGSLTWAFDPLHRSVSPVPFYAAAYKEFAKEVRCPVMFVSGGPEGWHPPDEDERLASFKNVTRVEYPDGGHMMHWTCAKELGDALVQFWQSAA